MKKSFKFFFFLFISISFISQANAGAFADFKTENFEFKGHDAKIVFPNQQNIDKNWIWRARFWAHQPQVDLALLEEGFCIVYLDVAGYYGNQFAVELWNEYYKFIVAKYDLNCKAALEGMSRGGLIIYNWASQNTDKVSCIYADAPVCDIKSWPGGLGKGLGSYYDWIGCLQVYNLNLNTVQNFEAIPINTCIHVAKAKIPVLHVCGDEDKHVPIEENTLILEKNFKKAGGEIQLIIKKGVGHHPHSLKDPKPIVDFILKNS